jgi:hypothetical protein
MAKAHVLDRVTVDLSKGHTHPAIQRLGSLVAEHPQDLDLRHRLAVIQRAVGNTIEAGRWDYLNQYADPEEIDAFERAYPDPGRRLHALRWQGLPQRAATEHARTRLEALVAEAAAQGKVFPSLSEPHVEVPRWVTRAALVAAGFGALGVLALGVIGVVTAVQWMMP